MIVFKENMSSHDQVRYEATDTIIPSLLRVDEDILTCAVIAQGRAFKMVYSVGDTTNAFSHIIGTKDNFYYSTIIKWTSRYHITKKVSNSSSVVPGYEYDQKHFFKTVSISVSQETSQSIFRKEVELLNEAQDFAQKNSTNLHNAVHNMPIEDLYHSITQLLIGRSEFIKRDTSSTYQQFRGVIRNNNSKVYKFSKYGIPNLPSSAATTALALDIKSTLDRKINVGYSNNYSLIVLAEDDCASIMIIPVPNLNKVNIKEQKEIDWI